MNTGLAARHLVQLVDEDDAILLGAPDGFFGDALHVDELGGFFLVKASSASGMLSRRRLVRLDWGNIDCRLTTISSMPVPENTSMNDWGVSLV